jgi:hypothetical protein
MADSYDCVVPSIAALEDRVKQVSFTVLVVTP